MTETTPYRSRDNVSEGGRRVFKRTTAPTRGHFLVHAGQRDLNSWSCWNPLPETCKPHTCATSSTPSLTRKPCPSGCRTCISRTFHGMSVGGKVTSSSAAKHCLWTSSTSSTQTDIQAPLSAVSSPCGPNVEAFAPLPRPPWPPWQRKISHSPDPTAPKVGGVPQSQHFLQPHFSNHTKLLEMSDTFNIGVTCFAFMLRRITRPGSAAINPFDPARLVGQLETWSALSGRRYAPKSRSPEIFQ